MLTNFRVKERNCSALKMYIYLALWRPWRLLRVDLVPLHEEILLSGIVLFSWLCTEQVSDPECFFKFADLFNLSPHDSLIKCDCVSSLSLSICLSGFCVVLRSMSTNCGKLRWTTALIEAERDSTSWQGVFCSDGPKTSWTPQENHW